MTRAEAEQALESAKAAAADAQLEWERSPKMRTHTRRLASRGAEQPFDAMVRLDGEVTRARRVLERVIEAETLRGAA